MRRTQIQLDERTYDALRRQAYESKCSLSAVVRRLVTASLESQASKRRRSIRDFTFVGSGRSRQGRLSPVSERHDEALAEALLTEDRR